MPMKISELGVLKLQGYREFASVHMTSYMVAP